MTPTHTENLKSSLSEAGGHLKQAASDTASTARNVAAAAGSEIKLGAAHLKADLADSALAGIDALEEGGAAAGEQVDVLLDKGRDLIDSAADLIRERPIAAFGAAFAAGWIIAKLARGR